ncbi:nuclease homologue [Halopseudomonas litoralis]|uniref:Nuclease homologue n=1 Tax=Halopseudomonas litoralis TaxID=797277 RepID=A0A1H1XS55_9GAMM|nr:thermonuclease family protein [Halopseudomonas litoralis]SDT11851.1 nuclease homologue [Halopseudomonas litoralis]
MALSVSQKASRWGAFFIVWMLVGPVFAGNCIQPGAGELVISRYVIDGDTLELVDGRRVRLIGINAPEIGRRGRASEPYAQKARAELERLVGEAGLRLMVGKDPKDHYGRTLGHLFDARGANIEAQLLRVGMGFAIGIAPNLTLFDCHLEQEALARSERVGVWGQAPVTRAADLQEGGFHLIRGRVVTIERAGRYVWVELDGPLTLRLPAAESQRFGELSSWKSRQLEVRGWIVDRQARRHSHKRFMLPLLEPRMVSFE